MVKSNSFGKHLYKSRPNYLGPLVTSLFIPPPPTQKKRELNVAHIFENALTPQKKREW